MSAQVLLSAVVMLFTTDILVALLALLVVAVQVAPIVFIFAGFSAQGKWQRETALL